MPLRPYKVYTALLSQEVDQAPTAIVLENSIGSIAWTYLNSGTYRGTLVKGFVTGKTVFFASINPNDTNINNSSIEAFMSSDDTITVVTADATGAKADSLLTNASFEIRVYN